MSGGTESAGLTAVQVSVAPSWSLFTRIVIVAVVMFPPSSIWPKETTGR